MNNSDKKTLLGSTGLVGAFTLLSRVLGFVRDAMMTHFLGSSGAAAVFWIAFQIPHFLRRVVGEGSLSAFIVPVYSGIERERGEADGWNYVSNVFNVFAVVTLILSAVLVLVPQPLFFLYGGSKYFYESGLEEQWRLGVRLTRIMMPFVMLLALTSLLMGVLHARRHFLAPSMGSIIVNLIMILCGCAFAVIAGNPSNPLIDRMDALPSFENRFVVVIAWAVILGGVLRVLILLPPLLSRGWRWRPLFNWRDPGVIELARKMVPAFVGLAVYQFNLMVNMTLAAWISDAAVSYITYSQRLMQLPLAILATAMATAILPQLTSYVLEQRKVELRGQLDFAYRILAVVYLPATVGLIVLGGPIVKFIFQSGEWTAADSAGTHFALIFYALGLLAVGIQQILTPVYYAQKDMVSPVKFGAISVAVNLTLCLILMQTRLTYGGLALAGTLSVMFNVCLLHRGQRELIGPFFTARMLHSLWRTALAALIMGAACYWGYGWTARALHVEGRLTVAMAALAWVAAGIMIYVAACWLLQLKELNSVMDILRRRRK
ncbi:murein biosynthesis integral membrane protein MurJ [Candidatus Sumerlaeota bacterium]|nr:murein biosynthesis integral membrane protein MurJ [Candidatus Sumerlaeota bacterium]